MLMRAVPGGEQEEVRCRVVTSGAAHGGCIVVSHKWKRSPPSILEVFLIELVVVLYLGVSNPGNWYRYILTG